ncbi:MAG: DUF368 domain-containing protein [Ignavibacteriae bacterium]|nr:DUF368 domain-containing protein [Ignavibacteriota bacterium]MCB9215662.1 DUF368 domain-containing protein [Ignavibacteria bacterium]
MGACDVVPGVSGGTMAFILGIYEELISSIRAVGRSEFLRAIVSFRLTDAARAINLPFLLSVLSGILIAILSLAKLMTWLLENQPVYLWSFFFGLVLASVLVVSKRIPKWNLLLVVALLVTAVAAYILVGLVPAQTPDDLGFVFLSGALAICAMILPGISGSFILLLLSKYQFIVGRVAKISDGTFATEDGVILGTFALGCGIGLITFAQLLGWLFKRYHDLTVALLTGLMLGSLRKVWPWKETIETYTDRHGEIQPLVQDNILPGFGTEVWIALALAVVGFIVVIAIEKMGNSELGDHV